MLLVVTVLCLPGEIKVCREMGFASARLGNRGLTNAQCVACRCGE